MSWCARYRILEVSPMAIMGLQWATVEISSPYADTAIHHLSAILGDASRRSEYDGFDAGENNGKIVI